MLKMEPITANIIVTITNLLGFIIIGCRGNWLIYTAIIASILMHISETKHGLPGIYPFNKYSDLFLWLDRILCLLVIYTVLKDWSKIPLRLKIYGIIGLIILTFAEFCTKDNIILYTILHSLWHIIAFTFYRFYLDLKFN